MNWVDAKAFLSRVVPWPVGGIGYVNLHYSMVNPRGGKDIVTGKPYQDIDQLLSFCNWAETTTNIKELWYCTSLQSASGTNTRGGAKAIRLKQNAMYLKAIWVDIDVKDDPKHYKTEREAFAAICKFRADNKLPQFSAVVKSGGGLHIYWISKTALDPQMWAPYAEGLKALLLKDGIKCDSGLTTDSARILRIPGTKNHKYTPPRPVELLDFPPRDYDFPLDLEMIAKAAPPTQVAQISATFDNSALVGKKPILAYDPNDDLSMGLREEVLLDPLPIVQKCGFMQHAFMEGGKDYDNPLWNLTLLCATFLKEGEVLAHAMSKGHVDYKPEETQREYERKLAERKTRKLGYPSCVTIKGSGCTACATCPIYRNGKSPLNIRPKKTDVVGLTTTGQQGRLLAPNDMYLPEGYFVAEHDGTIWKRVEREPNAKGEPQPDILLKLFYAKLSQPWAEGGNSEALHFLTTVDKGNVFKARIQQTDFGSHLLTTALNSQKVKYFPQNKAHLEGFFMAWLTKLHEAQASTEAQAFGWIGPAGEHTGFCYGGTTFHVDGRETPAGSADPNAEKWYRPTGSLKPWYDAHEMILRMKSPAHDAIMSVAFAAPLMTVAAEYSGMVSAYSNDSASQKSSAMKVALGVWGHAKNTKENETTTPVSMRLKLGTLKSLPVCWDEISTQEAQKKVIGILFAATHGVEGGRGTTKITQQHRGEWQLMMLTCANLSFVDYIVRSQPTTPAGVLRVLEFQVPYLGKDGTGMIGTTEASQVLQLLEGNYGMMGLKYAKFLAINYERVKRETSALLAKVDKDLSIAPAERFWKSSVGVMIQGAIYANELGAKFDIEELTKFLYETVLANRERLKNENLLGGSLTNTEDMLTAYLKERMDRTMWTDTFPTGAGRARGVNVLRPPVLHGDVRRAVQVRLDVTDRMLRISKKDLTDWLKERDIGISTILRGLKKNYTTTGDRRTLSAGTAYSVGPENIIHIAIPPGSPLEEMLTLWAPVPDPAVKPAA